MLSFLILFIRLSPFVITEVIWHHIDNDLITLDLIILFEIFLFRLVLVFACFYTYVDIYVLLLSIWVVKVLAFTEVFFICFHYSFPCYHLVHMKHNFR